jgi:hypothetical protein
MFVTHLEYASTRIYVLVQLKEKGTIEWGSSRKSCYDTFNDILT